LPGFNIPTWIFGVLRMVFGYLTNKSADPDPLGGMARYLDKVFSVHASQKFKFFWAFYLIYNISISFLNIGIQASRPTFYHNFCDSEPRHDVITCV